MGGTGFFFKILRVWDNLQLAALCRAGSKEGGGGHAWQDVGGTPSVSGVRGDVSPHLRLEMSRGSPEPVHGDTGVTPGHANVALWCAARWLCQGPGASKGGVPKASPPSWYGCSGETLGIPPCPQHDRCGSAFALSLLIADIYLIIEQAAPPHGS